MGKQPLKCAFCVARNIIIATPKNPPPPLFQGEGVDEILIDLVGFGMAFSIHLNDNLSVKKGKIGDMSKAWEQILAAVPSAKLGYCDFHRSLWRCLIDV